MTERTLHEERFFKLLEKDNTTKNDRERQSLFYILASEDIFPKNEILYDFKERWITPEGLKTVDLSSGLESMVLLAFNLYNCNSAPDPMSILNSLDDTNFEICMRAIQIRFGKGRFYFQDSTSTTKENSKISTGEITIEKTEKTTLDLEKLIIETNERLFESNVEADEKNNKYYYAVSMLIALYKQMQRNLENKESKI